jgi:hypothetical protein
MGMMLLQPLGALRFLTLILTIYEFYLIHVNSDPHFATLLCVICNMAASRKSISPSLPSSQLQKMLLADYCVAFLLTDMIKQILITYSESSLPGGSNETSFSSLGLS